MTLVFNALNVRPHVHDGAATFSLNVLHHLPAALPQTRVVALVQPGEKRLAPAPNLEVRHVGHGGGTAGRVVAESVWLSRELRRLEADVLVAPYESIPLAPPCPVVCIAQNLVYHCGGFFDGYLGATAAQRATSRAQGLYYLRRMRSAYRRAAAVVTVSEETTRVLAAHGGLDRAKATVVHEGSDSIFLPAPGTGTRDPRLLSVGTLAPHKDHEAAIDVFTSLAASRPELTLEIIGSSWRGYGSIVAEHAARSAAGSRIVLRQDLEPTAVARRYETSMMLLQFSRCEAFGLPVVEAMRYGLPVAVADRTALPEVAGGAALVVDPARVDRAAAAVLSVLDDPAAWDELAARGRARAEQLLWQRTAAGIAGAVREVATPSSRAVA